MLPARARARAYPTRSRHQLGRRAFFFALPADCARAPRHYKMASMYRMIRARHRRALARGPSLVKQTRVTCRVLPCARPDSCLSRGHPSTLLVFPVSLVLNAARPSLQRHQYFLGRGGWGGGGTHPLIKNSY